MTMCSQTSTLLSLFRLAQLSDTTLPVGGFSFSAGLEAAVEEGIVGSPLELEEYTKGALYAASECDCIALLEGYRAATNGDNLRLLEADLRLYSLKQGDENRTMTLRMGGRLLELIRSVAPLPLAEEFAQRVAEGSAVGCYPTVQAIAGVALGVGERPLFVAHLYGVAQMVLSAALRLMRITHLDTQQILFRIAPLCSRLYDRYASLTLEQMAPFAPTMELASSLHERGRSRLFMN